MPVQAVQFYFLKIHFNIIPPSPHIYAQGFEVILSSSFPDKSPIRISLLPHMRYMPCPYNPPWFVLLTQKEIGKKCKSQILSSWFFL
jgi:hypothetical protein